MGDTVQRLMEDMVPELEDLRSKKIFTSNEIQSLVAQRQGFEYKLRRKNISKLDFLRYIQYELNVVALIERRKLRLGLDKKKGVSDFSLMRRTSFLYERALRKFNHDVPLWKQYLEYCRRIGSHSAISKILPRALQLNPKEESLWILHASWELESQGNMDGARAVLQRALRLNESSRAIWLAFFRMEIRFIVRVLERKRALGLVETDGEKMEQHGEFDLRFKQGSAGTTSTEGETTATTTNTNNGPTPLATKQEHALTQVLLPRMILKNALRNSTLKVQPLFRLEFLRHVPSAYSAALSIISQADEVAFGEENDDDTDSFTSSSDPSSLHLGPYAYNHDVEDVLLSNFLKYNGRTSQQIAADEAKERQEAAAAGDVDDDETMSPPSKSTTNHLYHVDFRPLLDDLFDGLRSDFQHDVSVLRTLGQWRYVRTKVAHDVDGMKGEPEFEACQVFEDALEESNSAIIAQAAKDYLQTHKLLLDADKSRAGEKRLQRLKEPIGHLWLEYASMVGGLLNIEPESNNLHRKLADIYVAASAALATSTSSEVREELTRQRVDMLIKQGEIEEAKSILEQALAGPSSTSTTLWMTLIELKERTNDFNTATVNHDGHGKKRKQPASSSSTSTTATTASDSLIALCREAVLKVAPIDRTTFMRKEVQLRIDAWMAIEAPSPAASASSPCEPSIISSLRKSYLAIHSSFQGLLDHTARAENDVNQVKKSYVEWIAMVCTSDKYQTMVQGISNNKKKNTTQQQPKSKKQKRLAIVNGDDSDDADDADDGIVWPSYVPSLRLSPVAVMRAVVDQLLRTPPVGIEFIQTCIRVEDAFQPNVIGSGNSHVDLVASHDRRMKELFERGVATFGSTSPELWFAYLCWIRTNRTNAIGATAAANANQLHFRATKQLAPEYQAQWAELQSVLVQ